MVELSNLQKAVLKRYSQTYKYKQAVADKQLKQQTQTPMKTTPL